MKNIQYLNTLSELQDSGYGRPSPRHGLNLLYWFAKNCVKVYNDQMIARCSPDNGHYGFRLFQNKGRLLPPTYLPYYEVGNLNDFNAWSLPDYVRQDYTGYLDDSNTDRIIVCLDSDQFDSVYVTCHKKQWTFDCDQTYCISPQLIRTIRRMEREDFLNEVTGYLHVHLQSATISSVHENNNLPRNNDNCCCIILLMLIVFVIALLCLMSKH